VIRGLTRRHWTWRVKLRPFWLLADALEGVTSRASAGDGGIVAHGSVARRPRIVAAVSPAVTGGPICRSTSFGPVLTFAGL